METIALQENTDATGQKRIPCVKIVSPQSPKIRPPTQQSPLTKAHHRDSDYVNTDVIFAQQQQQQQQQHQHKQHLKSSLPEAAVSSCPDIPSHTYYNLLVEDDSYRQRASSASENSTCQVTKQNHQNARKSLADGAPGDHAYLIDTIKEQLPEVPQDLIVRLLLMKNIKGDVQQTIKDIKVYHLFMMKLQYITEDDCITALKHCQWDIHRAADWLIDKSAMITKAIV